MFRALICPSSGVCDCVVELPHWLISFCKDGGVFVSANLWCLVVFVFAGDKIEKNEMGRTCGAYGGGEVGV